MTREEAIEELERLLRHWDDLENDKRCFWGYDKEAVALALAALRFPTREMVERMRGEWIEDEFAISHCSLCGYEQEEPELITPFCPLCGAPMTDEAVQMVMERLEALHGDR